VLPDHRPPRGEFVAGRCEVPRARSSSATPTPWRWAGKSRRAGARSPAR
jgi:hypothetical protein